MEKVGIAGVGALGSIVAKRLLDGMDGYMLHAFSDNKPHITLPVPKMDFHTLARECDIIVECLPAAIAGELAHIVLDEGKALILVSAAALVLYPDLSQKAITSNGRIIVPSGALSGLDAVLGMAQSDITSARIVSTKPPSGFIGNPYLKECGISVEGLTEPLRLFFGNVAQAARIFPANVNVGVSLALASGLGFENTNIEVWADPNAATNSHEIFVVGKHGKLQSRIENIPDPANPKSSIQAALSILAALEKRHAKLTIY